jgi:hypothetical protein
MKDYFISMFIDNELDLDEKIGFVEEVHKDRAFKDETIELLEQEKHLRGEGVVHMPDMACPVKPQIKQNNFKVWFPSFAGFATACVLLIGIFLLHSAVPDEHNIERHRFVIYQPEARQAEIIGSFTNWVPVAMEKVGDSGYWAISLELPEGEHRYSYLLENGQQVADPTILAREQDDFGGENSIIKVAAL